VIDYRQGGKVVAKVVDDFFQNKKVYCRVTLPLMNYINVEKFYNYIPDTIPPIFIRKNFQRCVE